VLSHDVGRDATRSNHANAPSEEGVAR